MSLILGTSAALAWAYAEKPSVRDCSGISWGAMRDFWRDLRNAVPQLGRSRGDRKEKPETSWLMEAPSQSLKNLEFIEPLLSWVQKGIRAA